MCIGPDLSCFGNIDRRIETARANDVRSRPTAIKLLCLRMLKTHSILTFPRSFADTVTIARRLIRSVAGPVTTILSVGRTCLTSDFGRLRFIWFRSFRRRVGRA